MTIVTMLDFRKQADRVLARVAKGESIVLTYRGKPVARLEPVGAEAIAADDPVYGLAELASQSAKPLTNAAIDRIVYGG